jgi:glycosyltransferase involved in cell wall biosynthesis
MLRVPLLCTYHTDFPAYVDTLTRDHRVTNGAIAYMQWFYRQAASVFTRSNAYRFKLSDLGVSDDNILAIQPGVNVSKFSPSKRDSNLWPARGVREHKRLLYSGRVSVEKNLPMLVESFRKLCEKRRDAALVVAGDGPYLATMRDALRHLPAYFLGYQNDEELAALYASADLFVFPSRTDTLGQVVMEAQASGLPALVSGDGGPKESIEDGRSGIVLPGDDPSRWAATIAELLDDEPRRQRMAHAAGQRASRWSLNKTFEAFWAAHLHASEPLVREAAIFLPASPPFPNAGVSPT